MRMKRLDPIPLAFSDPETVEFRAATHALSEAGRAHRIDYASGSLTGLLAKVRAGVAITELTKTAVPKDLTILRKPASAADLTSWLTT